MPLARIDLVQGKSTEYRRTIGTIVYEAMVDVLKVPEDDRFGYRCGIHFRDYGFFVI